MSALVLGLMDGFLALSFLLFVIHIFVFAYREGCRIRDIKKEGE